MQNIAFAPVSQLSRLIAYELCCNSLSSLHSLSADFQLTMQIVATRQIGSFHTNHGAPKQSQIFAMTSIVVISIDRASVIKLIKIATWYREVTRFNENIYASTEVDGFGFDLIINSNPTSFIDACFNSDTRYDTLHSAKLECTLIQSDAS